MDFYITYVYILALYYLTAQISHDRWPVSQSVCLCALILELIKAKDFKFDMWVLSDIIFYHIIDHFILIIEIDHNL